MKRSRRIQFAKCSFDATDQGSIALNKWISRTGFMPHYVTTKKIPGARTWTAIMRRRYGLCVYTQCMTGSTRPLFAALSLLSKVPNMENNGENKIFWNKKTPENSEKRDTSERFFRSSLCYLRFDGFIGVFVPLSPVIKPQFKQEKCTLSMICWWFYNRFLMLIFLR